jgi:hypothetical protein
MPCRAHVAGALFGVRQELPLSQLPEATGEKQKEKRRNEQQKIVAEYRSMKNNLRVSQFATPSRVKAAILAALQKAGY